MRRVGFACTFLVFLVACGGSGGDGDATDPGTGDLSLAETGPDGEEGDVTADREEEATAPDAVDDTGADVPEDAAVDPGPDLPPRVCRTPTPWAPGTKAFSDISDQAGLRDLNVNGVRLGAADYDGDGRPDLSVRGYDNRRDDLAGNTIRNTFLLRNLGGMRFEDATRSSGFLASRDGGEGRLVHTVVWGDLDNDGDLDALTVVNVNPDPKAADTGDRTEAMLNDGTGHFILGPTSAIAGGENDRIAAFAVSLTDFDRDGNLDAWVGTAMGSLYPQPDRLFRGDGAASFTDVTKERGLMTKDWFSFNLSDILAGRSHRNTWGTTACDLNGDGWPELMSSVYGRYFSALWMGGEGGLYVDRSNESGFAMDPRRDWSTNLNAQCYCKLMPDAEDCAGVPAPPSYFSCTSVNNLRWDHDNDRKDFRLGGNHFSTACGDVDNDGDMDLATFTIVHWDVGDTSDPSELLINRGGAEPGFDRPGNEATGLARDPGRIDWNNGDMSGAFLDFDGDGRLDLLVGSSDYPGTRAALFHQKADGTFQQVAVADGIDHARSHGVAVADFDGDGDLDVALGHGTSRCSGDSSCHPTAEVHLFRNEVGQSANWLKVHLAGGPGTNRAAIGARVRVTAGGVTQTQEVGGGYGHFGIQHDLTLTFGLGAACDVEKVEVRWPDATLTTQVFEDVRANYLVRLAQGTALPEYVTAVP